MLNSNTQKTLDAIYPVGSIYLSVTLDTADKVAAALGGTWSKFTNDAYLKIVSSGAGSSGGNTDHKITTNQMPSHTHTQNAHAHKFNKGVQNEYSGYAVSGANGAARYLGWVEQSGGGGDNYSYTSSKGSYAANYETATNQNTGGQRLLSWLHWCLRLPTYCLRKVAKEVQYVK